ncbi:globin family protein [Paraglaciecola sp.]|uniref:globin family protein n=1 Tax=Paraglaciecola sp. TaxID=1920173 RepID=UPI003EF23E1E
MDIQVINAVQSSWKTVESIAPQAAALFYTNLFEAQPSLKPLFKGDIEQQGAKLMKMLGIAVNKLTELDVLVPELKKLAQRHVSYGVKDEHYGYVGEALLLTLEQGLEDAFTPDVEAAWTEVYGLVSKVMIEATK